MDLLVLNPEQAPEEEVLQWPVRDAARAVVIDDTHNMALLHVSRDGYYKLPGGGVDEGEDTETALHRECIEEIGRDVEIVAELGIVTEYRKFLSLKQVSHCYLARAVGSTAAPQFTEHEKERGFLPPLWVPLDEAERLLSTCTPLSKEGKEYIVPRDIAIVSAARKYL